MLKKDFKIFLSSFFFLLSSFFYSQTNLVPNPSFENYSSCPNNVNQVNKATPWDTYRNTPDYFNICSSISQVQVPKSYFGYQKASTGNAYCGFIAYYGSGFDREIIGVPLTSSLSISQKYYISFLVSRCDSNFVAGYSINKIGAKFCTVKPSSVSINNTAHFYTNSVITDTVNWTRIFGSFVADSAYKHLMIGNFFDDVNTTAVNDGNGNYGYYFVDDVCVSTDSLFTKNYFTSINEYQKENLISVFPNPSSDFFSIILENKDHVKIFNSLGYEIEFESELQLKKLIVNCKNWSNGIYFVKIKNISQKIIIIH